MEESISNIVRARQTFWRNSYVGLTFTDRRVDDFNLDGDKHPGGSGTVYGVDGRVRFARSYSFEWQVLGSYVTEPNAPDLIDTTKADGIGQVYLDDDGHTVALDGESLRGFAANAALTYNARHIYSYLQYFDNSPTFRTDNGFTTRNAFRQGSWSMGINFSPDREWPSEWNTGVDVSRIWDYSGHFRDEWVRPFVFFMLKGQTGLELSHLESRERYRGVLINGIRRTESISPRELRRWLTVGLRLSSDTASIVKSRSLPTVSH
ncbi:MAG: hypothetical protein E4G91_03275 [Candidatus Zixiibacteriota bacterium]|nr:MAG: hypothetical protein E4G91_03275 [candidate division Zixibacteria bacterium]